MLSDAGPDPVARRFGALESDLCTLLSAAADQMTWSCHPHSTCRSSSWLAAAARAGCGQRPTTTVRRRRAAPRLLQERRKRKQVRARDRRRPQDRRWLQNRRRLQVRRRLQNWRRLQSMCSLQNRSGERPKASAHCEPVADLTLGHVCMQQVQQGAVTLGPLPALAAPPPSVLPISVMRALSQSVSTWPVGFQPGVMMQPSPVQPEAYSAVRSLCCTLPHRSALRALTPDPLMFFWLPKTQLSYLPLDVAYAQAVRQVFQRRRLAAAGAGSASHAGAAGAPRPTSPAPTAPPAPAVDPNDAGLPVLPRTAFRPDPLLAVDRWYVGTKGIGWGSNGRLTPQGPAAGVRAWSLGRRRTLSLGAGLCGSGGTRPRKTFAGQASPRQPTARCRRLSSSAPMCRASFGALHGLCPSSPAYANPISLLCRCGSLVQASQGRLCHYKR